MDGAAALARIEHFVILYLENRSFDNLYGLFPGADGLLDDACQLKAPLQRDAEGRLYEKLPGPGGPGSLFDGLANHPFLIDPLISPHETTPDPTHMFFTQQAQINGGAMDRFVAFGSARAFSVGVYDTAKLPLARYAGDFTLCDRFFQSAFGGSFLNHQWLVSARTPSFPSATESLSREPEREPHTPFPVSPTGVFTGEDWSLTSDLYAVNTVQSINWPHDAASEESLLPSQTAPTIGDRLSEAGLSWAWYAGGWDEARAYAAGDPSATYTENVASFQFHHQPFVYFESFKEGAPGRAHLKDERDLLADLAQERLPAVAFVKPVGFDNEHPGYTNLRRGEDHAASLIEAIMQSSAWPTTAVIVTYDENGGFADHVSPPTIDRWGPGARIPALVISPRARKHHVDHTTYETVSVLATLEHRFGLAPLSSRDASAQDLSPAFSLSD